MAKYNTFVVVDYVRRKNLLVTSSAIKAEKIFKPGTKIEVWNENELIEKIYYARYKHSKDYIWRYIVEEKKYIGEKQKKAEMKNQRKKQR